MSITNITPIHIFLLIRWDLSNFNNLKNIAVITALKNIDVIAILITIVFNLLIPAIVIIPIINKIKSPIRGNASSYDLYFSEGNALSGLPNIATNGMHVSAIIPIILVEFENTDRHINIFANKLIKYNVTLIPKQR